MSGAFSLAPAYGNSVDSGRDRVHPKGVTNDKEMTVSRVVSDHFPIRPPDWHPA
jgi:hypothetical protein